MMRRVILATSLASIVAFTLGAGRDDPLAGRIAGTPVRCIDVARMGGPEIVDAQTILYRQSGRRIWKTGPVGECPSLRPFDTLVVDVYGGQLCRNDRFRTISTGMSIPSPACRFRAFVPYDALTKTR